MKFFSVTEVLGPYQDFSKIDPVTLEAAKDRGVRIHAAAASKFEGVYQVQRLEPGDEGYLQSLETWVEEMVERIVDVEPELVDPNLGYIGHVDLVAKLKTGAGAVIDYKTPTTESPTWRAQTAAYRRLASQRYRHLGFMLNPLAIALMLRADGRMPKAIIYQASDKDFQAFHAALTAHRYFKS